MSSLLANKWEEYFENFSHKEHTSSFWKARLRQAFQSGALAGAADVEKLAREIAMACYDKTPMSIVTQVVISDCAEAVLRRSLQPPLPQSPEAATARKGESTVNKCPNSALLP